MVFGSGSNLIIIIILEHCTTLQISEKYTIMPTPSDPEK